MTNQGDNKLFDNNPVHPGDQLRIMLDAKGWTQDELASVTGKSRQQINDIVTGKRGITADMAVSLAAALGNVPGYWMSLDSAYRLSQAGADPIPVQNRAKLYDLAPIKDMQRRGWIMPSKDIADIESELKRFFMTDSLDHVPDFPVAMRKSAPLVDLSPAQQAWCFRAHQLATAIRTKKYDKNKIISAKNKLRVLAKFPKNALHIPELLGDYGIRFVVVEPLPGAKIDGAAFWLDEHSPVIAISVRYDRIDAFWYTVMHEFAHIEHEDRISIDDNLVGDDSVTLVRDEVERRADATAVASLVDPRELDSFIRRVSPLYSKTKIIQFAHRINMHPGIIVGQLQHIGEVGYAAHREMLVKIRAVITKTALTDGWGRTIGPNKI